MASNTQEDTHGDIPSPYSAEDKFQRVMGQAKKNPKFHGIPVERERKRKQLVENGVKWRMSVDQITRYCAVMGEKMAKRTVYDYLGKVKLPKRYDKSGRHQSHHDYMTFESFLKIAEGIVESGYEVSVVNFNRVPGDGAGFRYDFKYRIGKYLFYGEVQLSDIAGTNWRKKHKNYLRWYERNSFPFRVLVVVDQKRDMSTIRGHAREVLRRHPKLNLFLYCPLEDLRNCVNAATEPIWKDKSGQVTALIES